MSSESCLLCGTGADIRPELSRDRYVINCPNCGLFEINRPALEDFTGRFTPEQAAILSHAVFKMHERDGIVWLDSDTINTILNSENVPGHIEQVDNFILTGNLNHKGANLVLP